MRNSKDILAGLMFIGIALIFGIGSQQYALGTALRMGPAYFPLLASLLLGAFGLAIVVHGFITAGTPFGPVSVRGLVLVLSAPVAFGLTLPGLGLVPATFIAAALGAAASRRTTPIGAVAIAAGLTAFSYVVFVMLVGVSTPAFEFL